jgi:opacity protein-like surface antigen
MRALDKFIFERDHFRDHGGRAMRIRISAVLAAALVWGSGAFAADMPVKAPPVVAAVFSWTGFYVGGHAGYAWGEANASGADTAALTATYGGTPHPKGFYGGVHGGYNVQLPNRVFVGVETSVDGFGINGLKDTLGIPPFSQLNVMSDWGLSVVGRGGYAFDRWLPYVLVGGTWMHDKENGFNPFIGPFNNLANWHNGLTAGFGVEYAFVNHWSARAQYRYVTLDRQLYNRVQVGGNGSIIDVGAAYHF